MTYCSVEEPAGFVPFPSFPELVMMCCLLRKPFLDTISCDDHTGPTVIPAGRDPT
jgi:hypothetical protein